MNEGLSVADALALGSRDGNGWGGDGGSWWVILLVLLFAGWGGNGAFGGNYGGGFAPATAQGVTDAFNFNSIQGDLAGIQAAISNGFNSQNVSFLTANGQNQLQICQGFDSVKQAIANSDYATLLGINNVSHHMDMCCCEIERGQDDIKYLMANNLNAILTASDKNTDRIINYLTNQEMDRLRTELQSAQFQISQQDQTTSIINQLMPIAKPAYLTASPYTALNPYSYANGFGYGCGNGCGCNN